MIIILFFIHANAFLLATEALDVTPEEEEEFDRCCLLVDEEVERQ